jgi:iron complex transport system permease protein
MIFCALAGFLFLLEHRFAPVQVWRWLLRIAAAGSAAGCFRLALNRADRSCRLILLACLCAGLCAVTPVGFPLGTVAAAALVCSALDTAMALHTAVIVGLALDISWGSGCAAAVFPLGTLVCRNLPKLLRIPGWLVCVLAGVLLTDGDSLLLAGAFLGAIVMLLLVIRISRNRNLLLSGVIAGTIANSLLMYLLSIAQNDELAGLTWWTLGDLQSADLLLLIPAAVILAVSAVFLAFSSRMLDALSLGDEQAFYLGVSPRKAAVLFICIGALLAANTVALAGIIGFCGLVVPHTIRRLYGSSHRKMLIPATLWGGAFLMFCDILSRIVSPGREIPIGVITAFIGGPVFLMLLNSRRFRYDHE